MLRQRVAKEDECWSLRSVERRAGHGSDHNRVGGKGTRNWIGRTELGSCVVLVLRGKHDRERQESSDAVI